MDKLKNLLFQIQSTTIFKLWSEMNNIRMFLNMTEYVANYHACIRSDFNGTTVFMNSTKDQTILTGIIPHPPPTHTHALKMKKYERGFNPSNKQFHSYHSLWQTSMWHIIYSYASWFLNTNTKYGVENFLNISNNVFNVRPPLHLQFATFN